MPWLCSDGNYRKLFRKDITIIMFEINKNRIGFFLIGLYGGGGEKVVLDLAKGFVRDGFVVDLLLFSRKGFLGDRIDSRINIIDLNVPRIFFSIFPLIKYLWRQKPLAVLATSEHANLVLLVAKLIYRTKTKILVRVGITFSDLFKQYKKKRDKLIPVLIKILYPRADWIIANSQNVAQDLVKISKIPKNKIKVIYNPKFVQDIIGKSKQGDWRYSEKFTILVAGRLEKQKDFMTLIEAFNLIRQKIDAQLIILGDGGERKNMENLAEKLGIKDDVHFLGFVQNPYFFMANADIFVSTSLWEGFSNVLIEAGILGLPIVATDCGSCSRELLAPDTNLDKQLKKGNIEYTEFGILTATQDAESLLKAVLELYNNNELRKKYSEKSTQRARDFEVKKILEKYKKIINI